MGDRPERQTLYSWYPPAQQCLAGGFDGGFEKGCKIWVWIYLPPFLLPTTPSLLKVPGLMSLGVLTWAARSQHKG